MKLKYRAAISLAAFFLTIMVTLSFWGMTQEQASMARSYMDGLETPNLARNSTAKRSDGGKKYVLADSYWEQMTRATINLFDLVKFATEWHASVPVPLLVDSFPRGFPSLGTERSNEPSLSFLFDMDGVVKQNLIKSNLIPFTDTNQFLLDFCNPANINNAIFVITIDYFTCTQNNQKPRSWVWHHVNRVPCTKEDKKLIKHAYSASCSWGMLDLFDWYLGKYGSSMTCCNICGIIPTLPSNISIGCGFHGLPEFTVIFTQWRGVSKSLLGRNLRLFAPTDYIEHHMGSSPVLPHSWFIESRATEFINHVIGGDSKDFLAVHLRTEKIHIAMKANGTQCILDAITKAHNVSQTTGIKHIMYFADEFAMIYYRDLFISNNITITKYDPKVFHLQPDNAGIIAQIEQNIASRGAGLILTGGGSFQYVIKRRYMINIKGKSSKLIYELPCPPHFP